LISRIKTRGTSGRGHGGRVMLLGGIDIQEKRLRGPMTEKGGKEGVELTFYERGSIRTFCKRKNGSGQSSKYQRKRLPLVRSLSRGKVIKKQVGRQYGLLALKWSVLFSSRQGGKRKSRRVFIQGNGTGVQKELQLGAENEGPENEGKQEPVQGTLSMEVVLKR